MKILLLALAITSCCGLVQANAKEKVAFSYCPMTRVMGHGRDVDLATAIDKAKNDCVMRGGIPGCCAKFYGEDTKVEHARIVGEADRLYGPK